MRISGPRQPPRRALDPQERKTRNRSLLVLGVLALVNLAVFARIGNPLTALSMQPTAITAEDRQQSGFADPMPEACTGHPVRIFQGLHGQLHLSGKLSEGRTLRLLLIELGLVGEQLDVLEAALRSTVDPSLLAGSGATARVAMDRRGGLTAIEIEVGDGHLVQACRDGDGFVARNLQQPLRTEMSVVAFTLGRNGDLVAAVEDAGEAPELADLVAERLAFEADPMSDLRAGDQVQVIVEKRWLGPHFHRYGTLVALRYKGAAGYFGHYRAKPEGGRAGFYDGEGRPVARSLLRTPLAFHAIDPDARGLLAPTVEFIDGRQGAMYRRPEGAPVVALAKGTVEFADFRGNEGLVLELRTEDGKLVRYAHLARLRREYRVGDEVAQGELVGLVGHTGLARNHRLRMELVDEKGDLLDPSLLSGHSRSVVARVGSPLREGSKANFMADVEAWREAMKKAARSAE